MDIIDKFDKLNSKSITVKSNEKEHTPEIDNLRQLRDEYSKKAQEIQKEIDEKIMSLHNMERYVRQYVIYETPGTIFYACIDGVERLFKGFKFKCKWMWTNFDFTSIVENIHTLSFSNDCDLIVNFENEDKVTITTKEEILKIIKEKVNAALAKTDETF